ncbi:hypothetical protein KA977_12665, partial [Candidatus Dependentiae bacterium]|nr:hypothetical protein [Candidatus Dependentiae bacterium]
MKLKKIFIRTAVVIFFLFVATISGIFIFHKPILNYIQKKAFKYALARVHREFKDLIIKVKNYEFDWDNRRIIVEGIYLNSKTGLDGFISKIIFQFDFSDKLYPVSEIKIFDINLYTSADFKVLLDKLKNLKIEPDTSNSTFFVKNIKVNKINAVLYDTFSDIKYRWRDIEVNLCFKYKQVEKLHIDSGKFSFLILNKGILSLLEKQKLAS